MRRLASVAVLAATAAVAAAPAPVGADERTERARAITPIERLGRWDGITFVPLKAGSVTPGHVHVLVHGWAPGARAQVEQHRGEKPLLAWGRAPGQR